MSTIARRIIAAPVRTASETWSIIVDLLSKEGGDGRIALGAVSGIASSLIADECLGDSPAVLAGSGPRLRIYCLYDEEAIDRSKANENPLSFDGTGGDWRLSLPCRTEDLEWVRTSLAAKSKRITAYDMDEDEGDSETGRSVAGKDVQIDVEGFLNV
ncbi:MAG: hypothetical protein AB7J13_12190 [Pyrinomonadaceae bacterium]|mgnify:CR=1 FL=1|nr:hypothetical protein [Pyrinomonadaceae bacterium]